MHKKLSLAFSLIIIIGCGGGGGGSNVNNAPAVSVAPTPTAPTSNLSFDELKEQFEGYYEYSDQWGLSAINASSAYARGATGKNITIGITDSGLDNSHIEIDTSRLSNNSALSYSNYTPNTRQKRHGTMVASVAAGDLEKTNNTPMHGVAFDADILFVAIQLAEPDPDYDPVDLGDDDGSGNVTNAPDFTGIDNFFKQLFEIYNDYNVDIVNNSYGYSGNIIDYTEAQVRYAFPKTIEEMAQIGVPDSEKTIYVWAAGNAGGYADQGVNYSHPELLPGMAHLIPEIQGHSIAVVSIDEGGEISDFSSRCGVAQDYCIAAPGGRVTAAYPTSSTDTGIYESNIASDDYNDCVVSNSCFAVTNGTSFAAPFVSGGLAVIAEHFEGQLGSVEIVNRMFATANKNGVYQDKTIYGQGLLDLDAATAPVGTVSALMSQSLSGPVTPAIFTSIQLTSPSFGDAITNGLSNQSVIFFDELDAPFRRPLNGLVSDYRNQIVNLDGLDQMRNFETHTHESEDSFFQIVKSRNQGIKNELLIPAHLRESHADKNNYLAFYNYQNNSFISQGINGSWSLGAFKDHDLRRINSLRSKLNNPWMNFTATGTSFGVIKKFIPQFDIAFAVSSGRNKFNSYEIFSESNSSTIALIEMQAKNKLPSIQFGILKENDANNGLSGSGALNESGNQITNFIGLSNSINFFGGKLFGSMYWGTASNASNNKGMIKSISNLKSSSFGFGYIAKSIIKKNDRIIFTIDQPIRIESGELGLNVPVYRTRQKEVLFNSLEVNLRPSGREINSRLEYSSAFRNVNLSFAVGYKTDPYHIKYMEDYGYLSLGANIRF
jgi:hypothetical protein